MQLQQAGDTQGRLRNALQFLKDLRSNVLRRDLGLLADTRTEALQDPAPRNVPLLKQELGDEARRIGIDQYLAKIERAVDDRLAAIEALRAEASKSLEAGNTAKAEESLRRATKIQQEISALGKEIRALENDLATLAKRDDKIEKHVKARSNKE